jgi:hypothetical protein
MSSTGLERSAKSHSSHEKRSFPSLNRGLHQPASRSASLQCGKNAAAVLFPFAKMAVVFVYSACLFAISLAWTPIDPQDIKPDDPNYKVQ